MSKAKITILGSGTSTGIPMLGCQCDVCTSENPKNKRLRTSILLEINDKKILVDTTPDLRHQLLREGIRDLSAVIITHEHADHLHGIDDLRPLCFGPPPKEIPVYTHNSCAEHMKAMFPYIFDTEKKFKGKPILGGGIPKLSLNKLKTNEIEEIAGEEFEFLLLPHGHTKTLGIIYKKFAYIIDCHEIPKETLNYLKSKKLDLLIIDCVTSEETHGSHLVQEESFQYIKDITPQRAGLIHMGHLLEHEELEKLAQESFDFPVGPLFDRQVLTI